MTETADLENYYFHQKGFETLEEIREWFEWQVPETFNIAEYACERWAESDPDRIALSLDRPDGDRTSYTFREVDRMASKFAAYLSEEGVGVGDRIAINGTQCVESLAGHLAAFKLGAVSVPLTVLLGSDGLAYRLSDCDASAFLVDEAAIDALRSVRDRVDSLELVVTYGDFDGDGEVTFEEAIDGQPRRFESRDTAAADEAFIIYTSGTTGQPKGVVHAHRHLLGELPQFLSLQCHRTDDDQVVRTVSEWSWIMSLPGMVLPALFYGLPVVGYAGDQFDPEVEFELIDRLGVTHLNLPPTAVRMMMQVEDPAAKYDLASLQSLTTGGEAADENIIEWVGDTFENAAFIEGYGTTEIGGLVCDDPAVGRDHRLGYFGVPSVGHEVAVLDPETGERIEEPHEIGELAVRYEGDPMLFLEYHNLPEKTEETIQDGWLLSDDLVSIDEDGYFRFHSRSDDVIISSGYRIAPKEIEEVLLTHPAVQHVGIIGIPHETRGEIPKAFVVLTDGSDPSEGLVAELQSHVKDRLAKYEYPREVEFTDEIPTTTTGKVRRQSLRSREGVDEE
ncbi:acyl-CoA synthetase [Halobellus rarus]|uniref:Acyl-CoA synthetase n=1 Tax=Halobellus rarus TaxID=1126237 RepID=A0ABD6CT33_9EURY|nr:AMP-binding protein [Halobellus rarus]